MFYRKNLRNNMFNTRKSILTSFASITKTDYTFYFPLCNSEYNTPFLNIIILAILSPIEQSRETKDLFKSNYRNWLSGEKSTLRHME